MSSLAHKPVLSAADMLRSSWSVSMLCVVVIAISHSAHGQKREMYRKNNNCMFHFLSFYSVVSFDLGTTEGCDCDTDVVTVTSKDIEDIEDVSYKGTYTVTWHMYSILIIQILCWAL